MTVETFFDKFDLFMGAPDAVETARRCILEWAVQGRLVPTQTGDKPIDLTIPSLASYRVDDDGNGLPSHWSVIPLDHLGEWRGGGTPSKSRPDFWKGTIPWVSPKDMKVFSIADAQDHISQAAIENSSTRLIPSGSILMVVRGMILAHTFPVAITTREVTINQDMKSLAPHHAELTSFILLVLRAFQPRVLAAIERSSHGTCKLGMDVLESLPIPLPPLAEQKRIVAKVDELMALCDRLEAQQKERDQKHALLARAALARFAEQPTPPNLKYLFHNAYVIDPDDIRKAILTMAVQGKLVPQDGNDEPACSLLQRIDSERLQMIKAKRIRRGDRIGPVPESAIPFDIPSSWEWRHLADVCFLITDGAHHTPQYLESGVPFLSVKDVSSGAINYSRTRFISLEAHEELCKRCRPEVGDILLTKIGTTGIAVTIEQKREFSIFVSLSLLKFSQGNLDRHYLKHLINSPLVRQQSADNTQGIGNKNLVLRLINKFILPIPPLAEQRRIVAKVDQLMALVDRLEAQLTESRGVAERLMQAVVAEMTSAHV